MMQDNHTTIDCDTYPVNECKSPTKHVYNMYVTIADHDQQAQKHHHHAAESDATSTDSVLDFDSHMYDLEYEQDTSSDHIRPALPSVLTGMTTPNSARQSDSSSTMQSLSTSSSSSSSSSPSPSSPNQFAWNDRFQAVHEMPETTFQDMHAKYRALTQLSVEFVDVAKAYGRTIISELHLSEQQKTVSARIHKGFAGGRKFVVNGMVFKLADDPIVNAESSTHMYGGQRERPEYASKAMAHELCGTINYYRAHEHNVFVPMQVMVDHLGFRLVAMPLLPLHKLVYGSDDGGATIHASDAKFNAIMERVATELHIGPCEYEVPNSPDTIKLFSAGDVEGHIGTDGRRYLLDLARSLPPESCSHTPHLLSESQSVFFRLLRPEFLKYLRTTNQCPPLHPDALTRWGHKGPGGQQRDAVVNQATEILVKQVIPRFAQELAATETSHESDQVGGNNIAEAMHRNGINMRHIGLVRSHIPQHCLSIRTKLLVEITQRALKAILRHALRESQARASSSFVTREHVVTFLNRVTRADTPDHSGFWCGTVTAMITERFGTVATTLSERQGALFGFVEPELVDMIEYVCLTAGVHLTPTCISQYRDHPVGFRFVPADISDFRPRVRHMSVVDYANAKLLSFRAHDVAVTEQSRESGRRVGVGRMLSMAARRFDDALRADPLRVEWEVDAAMTHGLIHAWRMNAAGRVSSCMICAVLV
jgi:Clustered mitochondria/Translation initiation factor eIF3 subunit 135